MRNLGKDLLSQSERIDPGENILDYAKEHAVFKVNGKEKTWSEIKKDDPALTLFKTPGQDVKIKYDFTSWFKKQDSMTQSMGRFFGGFANWDYIIETVGHGDFDKGTDIVSQWTYGQSQRWKQKDYVGMIASTPMVQNIALPVAGGAVLGGLVRGGSAVTGFVSSKGFTNTATALSYTGRGVLAGGTVAVGGLAVADIARSPSDKMLAKMLTYGTQFAGFGIGARSIQKLDFGPKTKIAVANEGNLAFQKFRTIGNKNLWKIGEPQVFGRTSSGGIARVVSPVSTSGRMNLNWMTASQFKNLNVNTRTPSWAPEETNRNF